MSPALPKAIDQTTRSRQAVVAVITQVLAVVVYSWTVFREPLTRLYGWTSAQTVMPYRYSLIAAAVGTVIGGLWQDRHGPRVVATAGGILAAIGFAISAVWGDSVAGLVFGWGIIAGLGSGFAYVAPIANLVRWFPDKRGTMVGLAVMGAGISPLFWSPLIEKFIGNDAVRLHETLPRTFEVMSLIFIVGVAGTAQFYRAPPPGWSPPGFHAEVRQKRATEMSAGEMFATWQFYALWIIYLLGAAVGLTAIAQASPLLRQFSSVAPVSAGIIVGIMGICNGSGRLAWGKLSDRIGRKAALIAMNLISIVVCIGFLRSVRGFRDLVVGLCLAAFVYGGFLSVMPSCSADFFGTGNVGGNYGFLFSAWGISGFVAPGYFEGLLDRAREAGQLTAGYRDVYTKLAILTAIAALIGAMLRKPRSKASASGIAVPR